MAGTFRARADFPTIAGVEPGGRVRRAGDRCGGDRVDRPAGRPGAPVSLVLRLDARLGRSCGRMPFRGSISRGSSAKVVEIVPGLPDAPPLADGGTLRTEPPMEVAAS